MRKIFVIALVPLLLIGCGPTSEKDRFAAASVEIGCTLFSNPEAYQDPVKFEEEMKVVFEKYGFDVSDEAAMEIIGNKYAEDLDVKKALEDGMKECGAGLFQ